MFGEPALRAPFGAAGVPRCALAAGTPDALSLFGLRTRNSTQAAPLSGMAQSVGYLLAALGPVLFSSCATRPAGGRGRWRPCSCWSSASWGWRRGSARTATSPPPERTLRDRPGGSGGRGCGDPIAVIDMDLFALMELLAEQGVASLFRFDVERVESGGPPWTVLFNGGPLGDEFFCADARTAEQGLELGLAFLREHHVSVPL